MQQQRGELVNLTVDSGAVRSCLQEKVAEGHPMRKVQNPAEFRAAGGEKLPELGTKTLNLKHASGHVMRKKFSVCEGIRINVLSTAELEDQNCRIVHQPAKYGGSFVEKLAEKPRPLKPSQGSRWERVHRRGNTYKMQVWIQPPKNGEGQAKP